MKTLSQNRKKKLNKIFIEIQGGLGNQLFQYAISRSIQLKCNGKIIIVKKIIKNPKNTQRKYLLDSFFLNIHSVNIISNFFFNIFNSFYCQKIIENKDFKFQNFIFEKKNIFLKGYWQSYKYFDDIKNILYKEIFEFIKFNNSDYLKYFNMIKNCKSVAMHIRRGDYISNINANNFHGFLGFDYYRRSIELIKKKNSNLKFFIFSDDIQWCKNKFYGDEFIFIECSDNNEILEMKLMSECNHFIIANSSFSWWPAFLSRSLHKIIICPKKWTLMKTNFKDLLPEEWIKI